MKIYITTNTSLGAKCKSWAIRNIPNDYQITDNLDDSDIFFSVFYNKILSQDFILKRKRLFNFHAGILPEYRGSGTINWAIINQEKKTGVTLHEIDRGIDQGDIIDIECIHILDNDTAYDLYARLEDKVFIMFKKWFNDLIHFKYKSIPQSRNTGTLYTRQDLKNAKDLTRFVRAFEFLDLENAFYFNRKGEKIYLKFD